MSNIDYHTKYLPSKKRYKRDALGGIPLVQFRFKRIGLAILAMSILTLFLYEKFIVSPVFESNQKTSMPVVLESNKANTKTDSLQVNTQNSVKSDRNQNSIKKLELDESSKVNQEKLSSVQVKKSEIVKVSFKKETDAPKNLSRNNKTENTFALADAPITKSVNDTIDKIDDAINPEGVRIIEKTTSEKVVAVKPLTNEQAKQIMDEHQKNMQKYYPLDHNKQKQISKKLMSALESIPQDTNNSLDTQDVEEKELTPIFENTEIDNFLESDYSKFLNDQLNN